MSQNRAEEVSISVIVAGVLSKTRVRVGDIIRVSNKPNAPSGDTYLNDRWSNQTYGVVRNLYISHQVVVLADLHMVDTGEYISLSWINGLAHPRIISVVERESK